MVTRYSASQSTAPEVVGSTVQDWINPKEASFYDHKEIAVPYPQKREKKAFQIVLRVKCKNLVYSGLFIHEGKQGNMDAGLSLRVGDRGFSPATKRVTPGYFYWKIKEK